MSLMDIPFTIKNLRRAGMTQTQIGRELGLAQTSVSDMETGKAGIKRPSYRVVIGLTRLAKKHRVAMELPPENKSQ